MSDNLRCPNCEHVLYGQFCANCGQNQKGSDRYFLTLLNEAFEGLFSLNSKAWLTTRALFFHPGFLTVEHFAHRRARYISPLRLYLITSIGFFILLSLVNLFSSNETFSLQVDQQFEEQQADAENDLSATEDESSLNLSKSETAEGEATQNQTPSSFEEVIENMPTVQLMVPFVSGERQLELNQAFTTKLKNALLLGKNRPHKLLAIVIDTAPPIIFTLLPIVALILKLMYLRSRRFYTEHLVFAVHNHSFLFGVMTCIIMSSVLASPSMDEWISSILILWVVLYMVLSLRRVFNQSWPKTLFKSFLLFFIYLALLNMALIITGIFGTMLL